MHDQHTVTTIDILSSQLTENTDHEICSKLQIGLFFSLGKVHRYDGVKHCSAGNNIDKLTHWPVSYMIWLVIVCSVLQNSAGFSYLLDLRVQNEQFSEEKGFSLRDTEKEV